MTDFFIRLDSLRKKKGEAITDIASFLGISGPAIHSWKKSGLPKPDKLCLLAEHYNVTVEWLLSGQSPPQNQEQLDAKNALQTAIDGLHEKIGLQAQIIESQRQTIEAQKQTIEAMKRDMGRSDQEEPSVPARSVRAGGKMQSA